MSSAARMAIRSRSSTNPTSPNLPMKSFYNSAQLLRRPSLAAEINRELATRRFDEFVRQAWPIVEPATPFVPGWHIEAIIEHLRLIGSQLRGGLVARARDVADF